MTRQEFQNLKVGDNVWMPDSWKRGYYISTEVIKIDKIFGKLEAVLSGCPKSYKWFSTKPKEKISFTAGLWIRIILK